MLPTAYLRFATFLLVLWIGFTAISCKKSKPKTAYIAGETYYGSNQYVRYIAGDDQSPIILSSPHDGALEPDQMADRASGSSLRDIYVSDLTLKMADSIKKITGLRPHVIINDLRRNKVEPNLSLTSSGITDAGAVKAYQEYHGFISLAQQTIRQKVGKGVYFDLHGHAHDKSRIEIGYLLSISDLNGTNDLLNNLANKSSIYHLALSSNLSFSSLIRGTQSLGDLFQSMGVPAIPSSADPQPLSDPYFNGGYCTYTYGSVNGGSISAIQLETPGPLVRNTASLRTSASGKMARAIITFVNLHYQMHL